MYSSLHRYTPFRNTCTLKRVPLQRKTRMPRRSTAKARSDRNLAKLKRSLIAERGGYCEACLPGCQGIVAHAHHIAGRGPGKDVDGNLLLCCMICHRRIESRRHEARELGFSKFRNGGDARDH